MVLHFSGFNDTFADLPVLAVECAEQITPSFLNSQYPRLMQGSYNWRKLTQKFWLDLANDAAA